MAACEEALDFALVALGANAMVRLLQPDRTVRPRRAIGFALASAVTCIPAIA
jgi:hypothetical protein